MSYCAKILTVPGYPHSPRVFQETADAFEGALKDLGLWAEDGRPIVFGAHLMHAQVPDGAVVFQTEALASPWMSREYLERLRRYWILDYAVENVAWLRERGVEAIHCPIGYHRSLTRLTLQAPSINMLFYGAITERRKPILDAVMATGLRCKFLTHDDDWRLRDYWLPRTKIILNLHAYSGSPLETIRLSYAVSNGAYVVTEAPVDGEWSLLVAQTHNLPAFCVDMCRPSLAAHRERVAELAKERFMTMLQADILREVLT